jgi:hypothetical protein
MSAQTPEIDVAYALASALGLAVGTDIKCGPRRPITEPGNDTVSIWVDSMGGNVSPFMNALVSGSFFSTNIQVRVISPVDDYASGKAQCRAVRAALHAQTIPTSNLPYTGCLAVEAEPNTLGRLPEGDGQYEFSLNFTLWWSAT